MFTVDYGRPLLRGRTLLGDVIPYDRVWRTGANARYAVYDVNPDKACRDAGPCGHIHAVYRATYQWS